MLEVDDIVLQMGNSLYQRSVDLYVSGKDIPLEQVQKAWRNTVGVIGPQSPVVPSLYQAVRETNMKRRGKHQMRILCGDPSIDWEKVKDLHDVIPYLSRREDWYAQVVQEEVLARRHRALLIMGGMHFLRNSQSGPPGPSIESKLRRAGARTYLIMVGTNTPRQLRRSGPSVRRVVRAGDCPRQWLDRGTACPVAHWRRWDTDSDETKLENTAPMGFSYSGPRNSLISVDDARSTRGHALWQGDPATVENPHDPQSDADFADALFPEKEENPQFPP